MAKSVHKVWVLVTRGENTSGWVAHVLDLDIVTQGESVASAFKMAAEATCLALDDDFRNGRDPFARTPAPQEDWAMLFATMRYGKPLEAIPKDQLLMAAGQMKIEELPKARTKAKAAKAKKPKPKVESKDWWMGTLREGSAPCAP